MPLAWYPCLSSSTYHAVCKAKVGLALIKLNVMLHHPDIWRQSSRRRGCGCGRRASAGGCISCGTCAEYNRRSGRPARATITTSLGDLRRPSCNQDTLNWHMDAFHFGLFLTTARTAHTSLLGYPSQAKQNELPSLVCSESKTVPRPGRTPHTATSEPFIP